MQHTGGEALFEWRDDIGEPKAGSQRETCKHGGDTVGPPDAARADGVEHSRRSELYKQHTQQHRCRPARRGMAGHDRDTGNDRKGGRDQTGDGRKDNLDAGLVRSNRGLAPRGDARLCAVIRDPDSQSGRSGRRNRDAKSVAAVGMRIFYDHVGVRCGHLPDCRPATARKKAKPGIVGLFDQKNSGDRAYSPIRHRRQIPTGTIIIRRTRCLVRRQCAREIDHRVRACKIGILPTRGVCVPSGVDRRKQAKNKQQSEANERLGPDIVSPRACARVFLSALGHDLPSPVAQAACTSSASSANSM